MDGPEGFPGGSAGKESGCNAGDLGSVPGMGRSPGEGKGSPLQYSSVLVAQSCPTLCDPTDCSPPASSVRGIFQTRILEWVAISFTSILEIIVLSEGSPTEEDRYHVISLICGI